MKKPLWLSRSGMTPDGQSDLIRTPKSHPGLATLVFVVHLLLVLFFLVGSLLPWRLAWWLVLLGGAGLRLIWMTNEGQCPLTVLEASLRQTDITSESSTEPAFVTSLLSRLTGRPISEQTGERIIHLALYVSMVCAAWRLFS